MKSVHPGGSFTGDSPGPVDSLVSGILHNPLVNGEAAKVSILGPVRDLKYCPNGRVFDSCQCQNRTRIETAGRSQLYGKGIEQVPFVNADDEAKPSDQESHNSSSDACAAKHFCLHWTQRRPCNAAASVTSTTKSSNPVGHTNGLKHIFHGRRTG